MLPIVLLAMTCVEYCDFLQTEISKKIAVVNTGHREKDDSWLKVRVGEKRKDESKAWSSVPCRAKGSVRIGTSFLRMVQSISHSYSRDILMQSWYTPVSTTIVLEPMSDALLASVKKNKTSSFYDARRILAHHQCLFIILCFFLNFTL